MRSSVSERREWSLWRMDRRRRVREGGRPWHWTRRDLGTKGPRDLSRISSES